MEDDDVCSDDYGTYESEFGEDSSSAHF